MDDADARAPTASPEHTPDSDMADAPAAPEPACAADEPLLHEAANAGASDAAPDDAVATGEEEQASEE